MALKEIDVCVLPARFEDILIVQQLGFDLSHLGEDCVEENGSFHVMEYSPKASWLSKFLRLPLQRINLNFGSSVMTPRYEEMDEYPINVLIDALNLIDGQTRIRAKNEWDDNF